MTNSSPSKTKTAVDHAEPSLQLELSLQTAEFTETSGMTSQSKTSLIAQTSRLATLTVMDAEVDGCHGLSNTSLIKKELF